MQRYHNMPIAGLCCIQVNIESKGCAVDSHPWLYFINRITLCPLCVFSRPTVPISSVYCSFLTTPTSMHVEHLPSVHAAPTS